MLWNLRFSRAEVKGARNRRDSFLSGTHSIDCCSVFWMNYHVLLCFHLALFTHWMIQVSICNVTSSFLHTGTGLLLTVMSFYRAVWEIIETLARGLLMNLHKSLWVQVVCVCVCGWMCACWWMHWERTHQLLLTIGWCGCHRQGVGVGVCEPDLLTLRPCSHWRQAPICKHDWLKSGSRLGWRQIVRIQLF